MKIDNLFIQMHHVTEETSLFYSIILDDFKDILKTRMKYKLELNEYEEVRNLLDMIDSINECIKPEEDKECTSSTTDL